MRLKRTQEQCQPLPGSGRSVGDIIAWPKLQWHDGHHVANEFWMSPIEKTILALIATIGAQSIILNTEAKNLLGWNKFHFGASTDDVLRASGGAAMNAVLRPNGELILNDLDFLAEDLQATFIFGSKGSGRYKAGLRPKGLTSIKLWGMLSKRKCFDYEPHAEAGLSHQYESLELGRSPCLR